MIRALFTLCALCALRVSAAELDSARFLRAVAQVESGGNAHALGRAGETGAHQLTPAARRDHATPEAHLAWLRAQLRAAGVDANAFNLALCWNAGLARTLAGRAPVSSYDYARRVENLYRRP